MDRDTTKTKTGAKNRRAAWTAFGGLGVAAGAALLTGVLPAQAVQGPNPNPPAQAGAQGQFQAPGLPGLPDPGIFGHTPGDGKPGEDHGTPHLPGLGDKPGKPHEGECCGKPEKPGKPHEGECCGKPEKPGKPEHGKPGEGHGKPGEGHGKPGEGHGKPGEGHGKPGEDHGKPGEKPGEEVAPPPPAPQAPPPPAPAAQPPQQLAFTGPSPELAPLAAFGGGLVALGGAAVALVSGRGRRGRHHAS